MTSDKMFKPLLERLRECTCHEDYTKRKMTDPSCQFHSGLHEEAADEIAALQDELAVVAESLIAWRIIAGKLARTVAAYQTYSPN